MLFHPSIADLVIDPGTSQSHRSFFAATCLEVPHSSHGFKVAATYATSIRRRFFMVGNQPLTTETAGKFILACGVKICRGLLTFAIFDGLARLYTCAGDLGSRLHVKGVLKSLERSAMTMV